MASAEEDDPVEQEVSSTIPHHMHACTHSRTYTRTQAHTHTHTYTYTHIHINIFASDQLPLSCLSIMSAPFSLTFLIHVSSSID